jgi:hypothetical protein
MNTPAIMLTAAYLIGLFGGIALFIAPFTRRCRADMGWARIALWLAGLVTVVWSLLGTTMLFWRQHFSRYGYFLLEHYKTMCTGAALGLLFLLILSGGLWRAFRRPSVASDNTPNI